MEPAISMLALSRRVCQWLGWRAPNGRLQDMSCRKAMLRLNRQGILKLPSRARPLGLQQRPSSTMNEDLEVPEIACSLAELGPISVLPITSRHSLESKAWFTMLDRYHYLGSGPLCGAQIRYMVKSSLYGCLGGLAFSSGAWALRSRDEYIGWSERARRENLCRVVCNDRFLILPSVEVKNLASHVLSLALSRLPEDWQERFHIRPVLVESFVNPDRFAGTCYLAANFKDVGQSAGRRDGKPKRVLLYPLCRGWRKILKTEPAIRLGEIPAPEAARHWAEEEFGTVRLYDNRLKERLYRLAQDFYGNPQGGIPEACGSKAATMGAYRFLNNPKVTMDVVLYAHKEATLERIKQHRVVLAPQDTTTLNYSTHPMTEGLGPISVSYDQKVGLLLHDTLAFTEDGTPLGVLDAQCWARDPKDRKKKERRHELPIEQKESMKWLRSFRRVAEVQKAASQTRLVSIGDRESDLYELFAEAAKDPTGPGLLVRAEKSRNRKVEEEALWDVMSQMDVEGAMKVHVPRRGSQKARDTWLDVRFAQVDLTPPKRSSFGPLRVWAVYILEQAEHAIDTPIEWMLLTTVEVKDLQDAKKRVEWYTHRWGIEIYHRTLKSGCRIKDRQLTTADRIEACLGIDMVVAWRIYHLTMLGRETPDVPCTVFFKDVEWKALYCYAKKTKVPPQKPPSLREAMFMVGAIGGHLGRKGDGFPGTQTLWRGLEKLYTATEMYAIFTHQEYTNPFELGP